jgi:phage-related minor tail protein
MNRKSFDRMVLALAISTLSVAGMSGAQQQSQQDQGKHQKQQQHKQEQQDKQQKKQAQRLSQQQQRQLIDQQQQRVVEYRQHLEEQERLAQQQIALLQQNRRMAQYRFQEQYSQRLREQQARLRSERYDYDRDPYFYTPPTYRYRRGDRYYETNEYGAKALRRAVNYGYGEGFRAGQADRSDRWRGDYKDSYAYRDANYGYSGYDGDRDDYNYYFREGFGPGYDDGYNDQYRHGRVTEGSYSMLDALLSQILNFQPLR